MAFDKLKNLFVENNDEDKNYSTEDLGAILSALGYEVRYNSDGTLTAFWR